jgi:signal transduction histidine kinase/ActR/RegA family two-component response regulator
VLRIRNSIFKKLLVAFMVVSLFTGLPLVLIAIDFNKHASGVRLEQSISQQMVIISGYFRTEFTIGLQRSLKQIAESDALRDYLSAAGDERIVTAKRLETNLLRQMADHPTYTGVYYADAEGKIIVSVSNGRRTSDLSSLNQKDSAGTRPALSITENHMVQVYQKVVTAPLLLSSGNMEWFMPPREVTVVGPFLDEDNRLSIVVALSTMDLESGGFGGLVIIRVELEEFVSRLHAMKFYNQNPIWLFDAAGKLLVAPAEKSLGLDPAGFLSTDFARDLQFNRTDQGLVAMQDLFIENDKPIIRLAYSIPSSLVLKDYQPAIYVFVLSLLFAIAIVGVLAYFVSRKFSRPIIELAQAAAHLADGNLSTRVQVAAGGEIGILCESFNAMSSKLQQAYQNRNSAIAVLRGTILQLSSEWKGLAKPTQVSQSAAEFGSRADADFEKSEDLIEIAAVIQRLLAERAQNLIEIQAARLIADEANSAKSDFLATISHEIRTPLNAVIGLADVLSRTNLSHQQKEMLDSMEIASVQLLQIINDVLDFSRMQSGTIQLNATSIDLKELLSRLMLIISGLPNSSNLEIRWSVDPSVPVKIFADEARLMQILTNLVGNAVKFTVEGSILVEVTSETVAGMPSIKFAVSDTGPGIPEKLQARLFEPFVQGSAERVRPHAGSGLGLAICRKIVSAMEGTIELVSSTPKGSRFEVIVPLRKPVSSAQDTSVQIAESSGFLPLDVQVADDSLAQRGAGRGVVAPLHILVAEDTPANQMVVKLMLNGLGHDVTLVNNGAEAVEAFGSARFDAVFLDIQMPVMDGYTAARAIRSSGHEGRSVPIAALTAFTQDSDREKARDCGIRHFVTKPIRAKDLTRVLEDMFADTPLHSELTKES